MTPLETPDVAPAFYSDGWRCRLSRDPDGYSCYQCTTTLSPTIIGVLFSASVISPPELVTSIVAVSQDVFTLAIAGIIGDNNFDLLFASLAAVG